MSIRNDGRPVGAPPASAPASQAVDGPYGTVPAAPPAGEEGDPPASGSGTQDQTVAVPASGSALARINLLDASPADPPTRRSPHAAIDPAAGPHDPFRPGPGVTEDDYTFGMRRGFFHVGFERERSGGDFNAGVMANGTGGGVTIGGMMRTPLGRHMSLAWGGNLEATVQKFGETTLVTVRPDVLTQLRYNDSKNQIALNAGLHSRMAVGWDQAAARENRQSAEALADTIAAEFDSLKDKIRQRLSQLGQVGEAFLSDVRAQLPAARDRFSQLLQERLQAQLGAAAQEMLPIITAEVGQAFGNYMGSLSTIIGNLSDAMQRAADARTPAQMQAAMQDFAANLAALQAATGPGSLQTHMDQLQQRLIDRLGPAGAQHAAAIGAAINSTATEVGSALMQQLNASLQAFTTQAGQVLTELFGDAARALTNTADAAGNAADSYRQMTTVALQARLGIGLEYGRKLDFLSSNRHDFATIVTVGGNYYHPLFEAAWADRGAPNPMVIGAVTGPQADWHASLGFQKWFGTMAIGANAGYRGTYSPGGGVTHSPEFGITFSSRFAN